MLCFPVIGSMVGRMLHAMGQNPRRGTPKGGRCHDCSYPSGGVPAAPGEFHGRPCLGKSRFCPDPVHGWNVRTEWDNPLVSGLGSAGLRQRQYRGQTAAEQRFQPNRYGRRCASDGRYLPGGALDGTHPAQRCCGDWAAALPPQTEPEGLSPCGRPSEQRTWREPETVPTRRILSQTTRLMQLHEPGCCRLGSVGGNGLYC